MGEIEINVQMTNNFEELTSLLEKANRQIKELSNTLEEINNFKIVTTVSKRLKVNNKAIIDDAVDKLYEYQKRSKL